MTELYRRIYQLLRTVPKGHITTYKALAQAVNSQAYQAIGQAMRHNPDAPLVPCHRVVKSDGTLGGFMGSTFGKELKRKKELLRSEGIQVRGNKIVNFEQVLFTFKSSEK